MKTEITYQQKNKIIKYVFGILENKVFGENVDLDKDISLELKYKKIFVTLIHNQEVVACQAGKNRENPSKHIKEAVVNCIRDKRFPPNFGKNDLKKTQVVISIFHSPKKLKSNTKKNILRQINPGVNAIKVQKDNKKAFFKESVLISKNYDTYIAVKKLCKKANIDFDKNINIYKYKSLSFYGEYEKKIKDLYRYNFLVKFGDVNENNLLDRIKIAKNWFCENIDTQKGMFEYIYYPSSQRYEKEEFNDIRQLASVWIAAKTENFLGTSDLIDVYKNVLNYYLSYEIEKNGYSYLDFHKRSIANSAFMILILLNIKDYNILNDIDSLVKRLANGILSMQQGSGRFFTKFGSSKIIGEDFFPGEAMLALMNMYSYYGDPIYLEAVEKAFPYYKQHWLENKSTAFIPWFTQVCFYLYKFTGNQEVLDFVFTMNDWAVDSFQLFETNEPDKLGGFKKKPGCSTASYLEGINDAYTLASMVSDNKHIQKYKQSLFYGIRFLFQLQFTNENTFYLKNKDKAIGGIKQSLTNNQIRNDSVQHTLASFIKFYKNFYE